MGKARARGAEGAADRGGGGGGLGVTRGGGFPAAARSCVSGCGCANKSARRSPTVASLCRGRSLNPRRAPSAMLDLLVHHPAATVAAAAVLAVRGGANGGEVAPGRSEAPRAAMPRAAERPRQG